MTPSSTRGHSLHPLALALVLPAFAASACTDAGPETGRVPVPGAVIAYESAGAAEHGTVLLIAGTGMQLTEWPDALVDDLVDAGYRVIRFDNRDTGLSTLTGEVKPLDPDAVEQALTTGQPAPVPYSFDDMADDAVALLDSLGVQEAHVVGISMGGAIAQLVAIRSPERVSSLTLLSSDSGNPDLPMVARPEAFEDMPQPPPPGDRDAAVEYRLALAQALAGPGYRTPEAELRPYVEESVDRAYDPDAQTRQETVSFVGHVESGPYRLANLERINAPTVVLHGADDPLVPVQAAHDIASRVPDAELRIISGWGHDLPDALVPVIVDAILSVAGAVSRDTPS